MKHCQLIKAQYINLPIYISALVVLYCLYILPRVVYAWQKLAFKLCFTSNEFSTVFPGIVSIKQ